LKINTKKGDKFWLAVDENDRDIGLISYSSIVSSKEVILYQLFVKPIINHQRVGSKLLNHAGKDLKLIGKTYIRFHLGE